MPKVESKTSSISIVTPFFNESEGVAFYFKSIIPILNGVTSEWEIICVDDGSTDNTFKLLKQAATKEKRIKIVTLSRNFGKEAALTAGLDHASKNVIIPIDADLQDPPEVIPEMIKKWREGYEVVNAVRRSRDDGFIKKLSAHLFYKLMALLTKGHIPGQVGDFRLLDKRVLSHITNFKEKSRYMKGIMSWVGFKTTDIYYDRPKRAKGSPKLGYLQLFRMALDGIVSFSSKPLKVWLYLGLIISIIAFFYACYLVGRTIIYGVDLPGYASIMVAILFMGGIQLISLGVIGEYIGRIFKEVKNRPIYIVDQVYGIEETTKRKRHQAS